MPWQVPITVDGLEYPVTFNTEGEPTQQDYDEAVQQILQQQQPASELPTEPTATPEKELPFFDLSDIGSSLGQAVTSLGRTIPASFGQLYEGTMNPWEKGPESLQRQKEMRDVQREAEQAQAEAEASGDASIIGRSIRSAQPSLGFSLTTLPASLGAGAVTGLGTAYLSGNPIIAQRAGMAAGGAAGGYAAYRMAGSQFLDDARERIDNFFLEKAGRLPNKQEQDEAYQELLPLAQEMGMAEALPEAFGNLALAGAGKYIYRILGGKTGVQQLASGALSKVKGMNALKAVGAGAAGAGTEVGTEAVTDVLQESPYKKLEEGIMRGQPVEAVEIPPFTLERFKQGVERVAEPTLATTAMMGLVGVAGGMAYRGLTRQSFEESEFRDKMTKQAESAEKQLSSPDITPAQRKFLADKVEESNAALKALDEGRSSDVEKYFNVRFTKAEEPSMPSPDEVAVQLNTDAAKSLEAAGSSESAKAQAGFDATLKEILGPPTEPTVPTLEEAEKAKPEVTPFSAEAPPTTPAVTPTDFNTRNKDMLPDEDNFGGKFTKPLQIDPASYRRDGEIETVNYINPETGNVDVFISAFGNNDFIAYMRQYDENGNPTNTFTSKLERRTEKAGATKKMLQFLQSRLPEGHFYTEDLSVSTDGLRFFLNQLNQGYEPVIENGRPATVSVAISGESIQNDLPIPVDPTGKFENIRITNPKDFAKVKTYLGKMLEGFGVGLNESNVRWRWEDGTAFIDLPVLRKVTPSPQIEEKVPSIVGGDFFVTPGKFYRIIVGDEAFQDIIDTGLVRTNSKSKIQESDSLAEKLKERPTAFPSFSKDKASMIYARENPDHYIIVSESDTLKPSTRARHGKGSTHFPTDEKGQPLKSLPASETVVYKHIGNGKYKRVFVGSDFAQITPSPTMEQTAAPAVEELRAQYAEREARAQKVEAPIQPENLQSALDAHTSGPKTPEQDWQFAVSMPEGVWIEDGLGGRMRKKIHRIKSSGSEEIEFEHQVFNEETGKWEDNPSAYAFMSKKKDGSLSVNNRFPSPLQPASYTEISTGERKISKPIVVLSSPKPVETQEDAAPEIPLKESLRQEPQDRIESREAEEAGAGDSLLRPAEGEVQEEVMPLPEVAADPFAAAPLVDNLPALIAVRDNTATPEQVQSLVAQGLVEQVDGQNIITEAGVAAMPEDQRPKLTPDERRAEVEVMAAPVFTRNEIIVSKQSVSRRSRPNGVDGESITEIKAPSKVSSPDNWNRLGDIEKLDATVEARLDFATGKVPKKTDKSWTAFAGRKTKTGRSVLARNVTYNEAIEAAKDFVESANFQPQTTAAEKQTPVPLREGTGAAGIVQSEPVEGSIPTDEKVSPETESESTEKSPDTEPSEVTLSIAKRFGGRIAWSQGDLAIIEGFQLFGSKSLYVAVVGDRYSLTDFTLMKPEQRKALLGDNEELFLRKREEIVEANNRMLAQNPDGPFTNGQTIVVSKNVPQNVASVFREWVRLLGLSAPTRIVLTTPQDGIDMAAKYGGKFRRIGVTSLMSDNERGQMTPLGGDDFHIFYKKDASYARTLEVLAHELGHILERQSFKNLPDDQRKAIIAEHEKWLKRVGSQKALDGIRELRSMRVGRIQPNVDRADERFEELNAYWKSFSEWFADQVSRWATTTEKPLTVVEKFFARLGKKLREFFSLKGSQFAPNKKVAEWLDSLSPEFNSVVEATFSKAETETPSSEKLDTVAQIDRLVQSGAKPEEMDKFIKSLSDDQFNELVASEAFDVDPKLAIKPKDNYDSKRIKRRKFVDAVNASTKEVRKTAQQVFQEEEAAAKKQEKLEQATKSSLNSVVGPQKKDPVQGTVTKADVETAREALTNSGEIPNAYLTNVYESREAFLADRVNERLFPATYARLKNEDGIEGLFSDGKTFVFAKDVVVSDLDRKLAKILGVSDEQAAARRVIIHESGHDAISRFLMSEKRELRGYLMRAYSDEQIAKLVEKYTEYADWRTNPESRLEALEELLMRDFEKMDKIPTGGVWDDIVQFLKRVWRRLTGQKGEPNLKELKDVVRLMRNAMKRPAVPLGSFRLKDGGEVKLSMIAPTAGITPEQDAEYMAAVEAGDMEKAQRMVDEAARATIPPIDRISIFDVRGKPVEVIKNATRRERKSLESDGMVGEILLPTGDTLSFNRMNALHGEVLNRLGIRKAAVVTGLLYPDGFLVTDRTSSELSENPSTPARIRAKYRVDEIGFYNDAIVGPWEELPESPTPIDPVTYDDNGNVIPLSQRFQPTSPDIRFSRPQFHSDTSAALTAGSEAARSTLYSERDMDIREAIRRAYEAMPKTNSVAVPIGELFAKTEELMPGVTQEEFSLVLQDLFEDNGAVLQEGEVVEPLTEQDRRYLAAVEAGDMQTAQGMVDDAARKAGFNVGPVPHGTTAGPFNEFRVPAYFGSGASMYAQADSEIVSWKGPRTSVNSLQASQIEDGLDSVTGPQGFDFDELYAGKANGRFVSFGGDGIYRFDGVDEEGNFEYTLVENLTPVRDNSFNIVGVEEAPQPTEFPRIIQAYLRMDNPAKLGAREGSRLAKGPNGSWDQGLYDQLVAAGYDGVIADDDWGGPWNKHYIVFSPSQIKSADPVTRDDQGRIIPLSRRFDTGADIRGQINVTTPEGRRAGFVVVMPRAAKASRIPIDEIKEASKPFKEGLIEASKGREEKAAFKGNVMRGNVVPDHNVNATELYKKVANDLLDSLLKNHDILDVAESVQDPDLQAELGMQIGGVVQPEDILNVRQYLGALLQRRLTVAISSEKNPRRLRQLEMARRSINAYSDGASGGGTALNNAKQVQNDPELKGDFFFSQATREKAQKAKDKLDAITGGTEKITDIITGAEEKAAEETTQAEVEAQESAVEDDEYAKLVSEGEEGLEGRRKTIWERAKMILRRLAMYARADKLDIKEGSKASLSAEQRKELDELNAILRMPKAERDKAREKDLAEFDALMTEFFGLESEAKTPEQKKTRKKREKMVNTAKKRAEAGKDIETPQEGEAESSEEQVSKAERTAQAILKDLSERYSDPLIIKEKKPNVDAMRELYKERVKQGVGPNQMTEKSFVNKAVELGADETTAGILWKAAELEIDAREAMRQDKILQRKAAVGARADAQAHRIIFAKERLKRQSGFAGIDTNPNKDTIIQAFRDQVKNPVSLEDFVARLKSLNVIETVANRLFNAAEREKADLEAMEAFRMLEGPDALKRMLREMNKARPADSVPLERAMPWRKILSSKPKDVAEYRQRIFEVISDLPSFQNLTDEQKERLADLYTESWEARLQQVNDRVLREEFKKARDRDEISDDVEKKLQQSRNKILEIINLGGFNNDDLIKILGERYGISTEFTEEQKARIQELADQLQDETLNPAKRNKLAMEFAVTLAGASEIPVAEIIANWWTSSVLFGPQTIFSIGAAFLNGGYSIATIGTRRMLAKLVKGDIQGAIEESILMLKGFARYLGAFKQSGRRAWNYLWSGDVGLLGIGSNDILSEISNFEQLQKFQRHKLLAEQLAKDPKRVRRYVGIYLRFVSRLLTALDAFNVMVTKAGTASLALRMSGMSTENIIKAEKMLKLKAYKDQVIRDYFDNKAPRTPYEKGLVDSYAEAEMYRAINKLGGKMENADYLASESAMTMNPTGLGGFFYRSITGFDSKMKKAAEDYLEKAKKDWTTEKDLESTLFLGLAYLRQFAVQNLGGVAGYKFIRFASNKFNQGISYLPMVGLLRTLEAKGDDIKGKEAFIETIHRNQVIGAVLTLAAIAVVKALEDEPDDEERGNFWNGGWQNLTPDQKKQMLAKGQKEYTMGFKFNGRWYVFNYQNWPLNQVLAAIGSMSDQIRFSPKQWEEKGPLSKSLAGIVSGLKSTLEIPALSQLGTLVGNRLASKDPTEQTVDRLSNVAAGWVGGFVPRILKDLDFATQPELRKYKTLWEKTASHIPIYRRYVGEDYYDILGQPIKRNVIPGSREFMMGPTEPEYKILGALNSRNIFLTPANAEYRMVGKGRNRRRLTQEEADAYSLETGKGYRQMLLRYGQRALQMPTERARAFLSDKADEVRDRALKKVYRR